MNKDAARSLLRFKLMTGIPVLLFILWVWTRPCIMYPSSKYSAWDIGYKASYGKYPDTCDSWMCRVHNKSISWLP